VATFYQTYAEAVLRFVYPRVGERYEDTEEIMQDVFLSAVSLAATYRESCSVFTWLCGIAKLRIVDFYRRQGPGKRIPPDKLVALDEETLQALQEWEAGVSPVDEAIRRVDTARLVDVMLASLTDNEREALLLRYIEGASVREIAVLLKRTEKAIEGLLSRAKKKAAKAAVGWV
jgi:RNA polymerase sigma-70 factor (ECF subfamily)